MDSVFSDIKEKMRQARAEKYALQSIARKALPDERVSKCLRLVHNKTFVELWKHIKTGKAFYNGLLVCGSVWHCPVCAVKISERRKEELYKAFEQFKKEGGKIGFLTLTFSHSRYDNLSNNLDLFTKASRKFKSGTPYQKIKNEMDIIGTVKALEVTYSDENGFHPHSHEIIFYKNDIDLEIYEDKLYYIWEKACKKYGLKVIRKRGLTLQSGDKAQEYLSKNNTWSLENEMTKSHVKKAKKDKGLSMFDFLRKYEETENPYYLKLFQEYAYTFKGKRQLVWSRGLKKRFLIEEKTDKEVATEKIEEADLLGLIKYEDWKIILKYELRAELLSKIEKFGFDLGKKLTIDKWKSIKKDTIKNNDTFGI